MKVAGMTSRSGETGPGDLSSDRRGKAGVAYKCILLTPYASNAKSIYTGHLMRMHKELE